MHKEDVTVGKVYRARHTSGFIDVKLLDIISYRGRNTYICLSLKTGRTLRFKSAAKFRFEVTPEFEAIEKRVRDGKSAAGNDYEETA